MFIERGEMFNGIRSYICRRTVLCRFRIDPVPYTKKHKRIGSCFRHVRTYNELKNYEASDVEFEVKEVFLIYLLLGMMFITVTCQYVLGKELRKRSNGCKLTYIWLYD